MRAAVAACLLATLAAAPSARAEPPPFMPGVQPPRMRYSMGLALKNTFITNREPKYRDFLESYGYDTGSFGILMELMVDAATRLQDDWEVGGRLGYGFAPWDSTSEGGSDLSLDAIDAGVIARKLHRGYPIGLEVGVGIVIPLLTLRGETDSSAVPYWKIELVYRSMHRGFGPFFQFGYMHAPWKNALGDGIDMPLGGLTTTGGLTLLY